MNYLPVEAIDSETTPSPFPLKLPMIYELGADYRGSKRIIARVSNESTENYLCKDELPPPISSFPSKELSK